MDVQEEEDRVVRRRRGYLAASVGTVAGAFVGATIGALVGVPLAEEVAGGVEGTGDSEGIEAVIEGAGVGLGKAIVTVLVLVLAVVVVTWLGAVLGCMLTLRASGNDRAARTALYTGLVGPPLLFAAAAGAQALVGTIRGGTAAAFYGLVTAAAALAGRWLALRGPARRAATGGARQGPAPGFAELPTDR